MVLSCEVTGHPPPLTILWRMTWLGEDSQDLVTDYSSPQAARLLLNMTASNSSEVTVSCSASNLLGASSSNPVSLYVVGEC